MFNFAWYNSLAKPALSAPKFLFAPVWSILYLTILISFVLYFNEKSEDKVFGYLYFLLQMIFNSIWTPVFFGLKNIALALFVIILLDVFVFFNIKEFYKVSKISAIILIPYFVWILYATYLNIGYFILNK